jgi:hypothetical protein
MAKQAFTFNMDARYKAGSSFKPKHVDLAKTHVVVATTGESFETEYANVFEGYKLPYVKSNQVVDAWGSHPMQFWQNQLNFAVWCSTAGCGVSAGDHLEAGDALSRSMFAFHLHYQVRRILEEIKAPLPQDHAWSALNNPIDQRAYEKICTEFGLHPNDDWRVKGPNAGLGLVYFYVTGKGYMPVWRALGDPKHFNPAHMSFTRQATHVLHVAYIEQGAEADWSRFIPDKSEGFTRAGVERLNDSIRTYIWAILGAQAQTRTGILGTGTAFDAQKQFLANVEDAISSPVDLPAAIKRYQAVLQYAASRVDFVFGIGLYMAPSNMELHVGKIAGYNNEIIVATKDQKLGVNDGVNPTPTFRVPQPGDMASTPPPAPKPPSRHMTKPPSHLLPESGRQHDNEKTALIVGGVAVGLFAIWMLD